MPVDVAVPVAVAVAVAVVVAVPLSFLAILFVLRPPFPATQSDRKRLCALVIVVSNWRHRHAMDDTFSPSHSHGMMMTMTTTTMMMILDRRHRPRPKRLACGWERISCRSSQAMVIMVNCY